MSPAFISFLLGMVVIAAALRLKGGSPDNRWLERKTKNKNIPPGSMGWPVIGETLSFIKRHPCTSLGDYMEERIHKYGKIFKTHLHGTPTIVSTDPELNDFVLRNDGKLFEANWPESMVQLFGKTSVLTTTGEEHRFLKSLMVNFLNNTRLKNQFFTDANNLVIQVLSTWKENSAFSLKGEAAKVAFWIFAKNVLSLNHQDPITDKLDMMYTSFWKGLFAVPLKLPGTLYNKALQARKDIVIVFKELMEGRLMKRRDGVDTIGEDDFLGYVLERSNLNAEEFGDLLMAMIFAGFETSTTAISLAIYFLQACPKAVEQLREEHLKILREKTQTDELGTLTWEDYKQVEFTHSVICEVLRLGNVARMVYRKATTHVHFKGYDIPSGWNVIPVLSAAHLDPSVYEDPQNFNPWRCKIDSTSPIGNDNYMPFGRGMHKCAGSEVAKMIITVFIHHFMLNYDWEHVEPDHPTAYDFPNFPKGLPIKVKKIGDPLIKPMSQDH